MNVKKAVSGGGPALTRVQATQWLDYWTGVPLPGNTTIDNYPAPLSTLPVRPPPHRVVLYHAVSRLVFGAGLLLV